MVWPLSRVSDFARREWTFLAQALTGIGQVAILQAIEDRATHWFSFPILNRASNSGARLVGWIEGESQEGKGCVSLRSYEGLESGAKRGGGADQRLSSILSRMRERCLSRALNFSMSSLFFSINTSISSITSIDALAICSKKIAVHFWPVLPRIFHRFSVSEAKCPNSTTLMSMRLNLR